MPKSLATLLVQSAATQQSHENGVAVTWKRRILLIPGYPSWPCTTPLRFAVCPMGELRTGGGFYLGDRWLQAVDLDFPWRGAESHVPDTAATIGHTSSPATKNNNIVIDIRSIGSQKPSQPANGSTTPMLRFAVYFHRCQRT